MYANTSIPIGSLVTAPYRTSGYDGRTWTGILLAQADPLAWVGTLAFPGDKPASAEAVARHVAWCHSQELLDDKVPVLWDFQEHGTKVQWETAATILLVEVEPTRAAA
jgi:hypothetical protein